MEKRKINAMVSFELTEQDVRDWMKTKMGEALNDSIVLKDEDWADCIKDLSLCNNSFIKSAHVVRQQIANRIFWRDIILIDGDYFLREFPVSLELENDVDSDYLLFPTFEEEILEMLDDSVCYNLDNFYDCVEKEFGVNKDDIKTYTMDDIEIPQKVIEEKDFDIAWLGGYINGLNI